MNTATLTPGAALADSGSATPAANPPGTALAPAANASAPEPVASALAPWSPKTLSENIKVVLAQPAVRKVLPLIVMLAVLVVFWYCCLSLPALLLLCGSGRSSSRRFRHRFFPSKFEL